jgi:hypothetical protein
VSVALFLAARGAWRAHQLAPASGEAPVLGAAWVALQPRVVALVLGLSAGAALLAWLLRLLLVAGALPALAGAMGPAAPGPPRFAVGVARGLPRLLPTAALALALEWTGVLFAVGVGAAAIQVSSVAVGSGRVALAAAVAAALVLALLVLLLTSAVAEVALIRTAVRGDGPVEAILQASSRVLARPAVFLLASLGFAGISLVASVALQSAGGVATGFASRAPALVMQGPALMLSVAAMTLAAALELWWLASLTVLAAREG